MTGDFPTAMRRAGRAALLACGLLACFAAAPAAGQQAGVGELEAKVAAARGEAQALAAELESRQAELVVARQRAAEASAREQALAGLLAVGEARAAELARRLAASRERLAQERRRLARARAALARRLVAIYKSGVPDATAVVLGADGFEDLVTRADYLKLLEDSDSRLAARVEQVRDRVRIRVEATESLKRRADAYNRRLSAARDQMAAVRAQAESAAAGLAAVAQSRQATLAALQSSIGGWVADIEAARAAARRADASEESAAAEIERWLGGPYSIPNYIVMCESGGNYSALNPSSGAGGAYQIMPSTWELYGGEGAPHEAPKSEQDQIAAEIWADSGSSPWVCAG
jgi:septal ring factor EnvC (AmiA/AmiB activator)